MATIPQPNDGGGGPCFICGLSDLASESQPRRRYAELTTIFKTLVMTTDLRKKLDGSVYSDFTTNIESCATCLTTIKEVCALHQEIVTLQTDMHRLFEGARVKLGKILPKLVKKVTRQTSQRNCKVNKRAKIVEAEEVADSRLDSFNDEIEIKEECEDLFYQDAEIIPDSSKLMQMDPLSLDGDDSTFDGLDTKYKLDKYLTENDLKTTPNQLYSTLTWLFVARRRDNFIAL